MVMFEERQNNNLCLHPAKYIPLHRYRLCYAERNIALVLRTYILLGGGTPQHGDRGDKTLERAACGLRLLDFTVRTGK